MDNRDRGIPAAQHGGMTTATTPSHSDQAATVLRCTGTADFLAALPYLAGFTSQNSVFLVIFQGRQARSAVRIDLPDPHDSPAILSLLDGIVDLLDETGAGPEGPAIVITSEQSFAEAGGAPWRRFARLIRRRFSREGWPLRELAVVAADGWAAMLGPDRGPRPLDEISASAIGSEAAEAATVAGLEPPGPLDAYGVLPEPAPDIAASIVSRLAEMDDRAEADRREPADPSVRLHGIARVAGACFDPPDAKRPSGAPGSAGALPAPQLCARFIRAAEQPQHWMIAALTAITRPDFVIGLIEEAPPRRFAAMPLDRSTRGGVEQTEHAENVDRQDQWSIRMLLEGLSVETPDRSKLVRAIEAVAAITAHAPLARRPGLLAFLAWAWWMRGLQSVAFRLVGEALDLDPGHETSRMVERLIETPPAWLRVGIPGFSEPVSAGPQR